LDELIQKIGTGSKIGSKHSMKRRVRHGQSAAGMVSMRRCPSSQ
jgi:hypothetical protein